MESKKFSFEFWNIWNFIRGRKKTLITIIGMVCVKLTLDSDITGLLAGGAVFEGLWSLGEYFFNHIKVE